MIYCFLVVWVAALVAKGSAEFHQWSSLVERKEFALDMHDLRSRDVGEEYVHEDPFIHTQELVEALNQGVKAFTVSASVMDKPKPDMEYEDIVEMKEFNITTDYFLHAAADYHLLDDTHTLSTVSDVTDQHLIHCGAAGRGIKTGDFIVGTATGAWRGSHFSVKTKHRKGLIYTRRAVAQTPYDAHSLVAEDGSPQVCFKTTTAEVHPFELFDSFHMVSSTHVPFVYDNFDFSDKTTYQQPEDLYAAGFTTESTPVDPPAQSCASVQDQYFSGWFGSEGTFHDGANDDFSIIAGWTVGCVSANMRFPCCSAFNFNYNQNTRAATSSLNLASPGINGLTCPNCYAYSGAYLMAIVDYYSSGHYMAMEVKVRGALGFNVAASMYNPAFSGSIEKTLMAPNNNAVYILPIGYGMRIATNFGGLVGVLSGSGTATGSATFNTGADASAYLGVGYHSLQNKGKGWTLPNGVNYYVRYPTATYQSFRVSSINVNVELVATQDFEVGYIWLGMSYISASFELALTGSANYAYYASAAVTPSMTVSVASASRPAAHSKILSSSDHHKPLSLSPGDIVGLSVEYTNFIPGERTELFVSVHRDDDISDSGISILQVPFTVNGAGNGTVEFNWVIPWNMHLLQTVDDGSRHPTSALQSRIAVHASNHMSTRYFAKKQLSITADPLTHGVVSAPAPSETVVVNSTYRVLWDNSGFITFKRSVAGTSGLGSLEMVPFVNIELMYEDLTTSGTTAFAGHIRLNAEPVANTRSAPVVFPSSALDGVTSGCKRRFFLVVSSTEVTNLMGWSKGYFNLELPDQDHTDAMAVEEQVRGLHKAARDFYRPAGAPKLPAAHIVRAVPLSGNAATPDATCTSRTSVTYTSTVEGSFTGVSLVGFFFPIDGVEGGFKLLQAEACVLKPFVETADPVVAPDSSSGDGGLSAAWVAGVSVISTVITLLLAAGLYSLYAARCKVAEKQAAALDMADVGGVPAGVDQRSVQDTVKDTANPLAAVEV